MEIVDFVGSEIGYWKVERITPVIGEIITPFQFLSIQEGSLTSHQTADWFIKGVRSNQRYTHRNESEELLLRPSPLGREEATLAALIPIKKSEAWWALSQDERRFIFQEQSKHIIIGLKYLPTISRKLYHCRDLGQEFDFITWFEYAPQHSKLFEELVDSLRKSDEWNYVNREIDIRLSR